MDGTVVAAWVGAGAIVLGNIGILWFSLRRFDRDRAKANGRMEETLKNLKKASDECSEGIKEVSEGVGSMREHCAAMTSTFAAQITGLRKDVDSLQKEEKE